MAHTKHHTRPQLASALVWLALGFAVSGCVAKPAFHCQSDDSCVSPDGSRGTCEASGECSFHAALGDAGGSGGASGASTSTAGATSSAGGASGDGGHSGSAGHVDAGGDAAGAPDAMGAAGASCTDETAGNCYSCSPKTSEQFLSACTSAACVPFDDHARLTNLTASGALPPLPPASGQ
jgi:hypothetical protein